MKIKYKTRRVLSLLILLFGLPVYVICVVTGMAFFPNVPAFLELFLYVCFGVAWVFPVKFVFKGIGQNDPK